MARSRATIDLHSIFAVLRPALGASVSGKR